MWRNVASKIVSGRSHAAARCCACLRLPPSRAYCRLYAARTTATVPSLPPPAGLPRRHHSRMPAFLPVHSRMPVYRTCNLPRTPPARATTCCNNASPLCQPRRLTIDAATIPYCARRGIYAMWDRSPLSLNYHHVVRGMCAATCLPERALIPPRNSYDARVDIAYDTLYACLS